MTDQTAAMVAQIAEQVKRLPAMEEKVNRIVVALDGNPETDTKGLRVRVRELELQVATLEETLDKYRWIVYGIGLGLGVTGISSIGSLLLQVFKP